LYFGHTDCSICSIQIQAKLLYIVGFNAYYHQYIVFLKNWIYKGKWLKVISTYVVLMYTIYVLMFYMLPDVLLGVWVYIFNLNIDFLMVFRCLYLAISIILTVIIVWIGVIGIREKTYENQ